MMGLSVLFFVAGSDGNMALGETQEATGSPPMSMALGSAVPIESLVDQMYLKTYEAAGDLSLCSEDKHCLKYAKVIKSWICAADACGAGKNNKPVDCFKDIPKKSSTENLDQINSSFCYLIRSPGSEARRELMGRISVADGTEHRLVEYGAYLLALKGSALSCENTIKSYVGPYGSKWSSDWYKALSGCRILAHETTRGQEEKDFYTWFGVVQGLNNCSGIINSDMRNACNASGAASPVPVQYGG